MKLPKPTTSIRITDTQYHHARNLIAKYAQTSGAGPHANRKYSRKEKHKNFLKIED